MEEMIKPVGTLEEIQHEVRSYEDALDKQKADMKALEDQQATELRELHAMHADERKNLSNVSTLPACPKMKEMKTQAELCMAEYRRSRREENELEDFIKRIPVNKKNDRDVSVSSIQEKLQHVVEDERKAIQEKAADLHARLTQFWVILSPKTTADVSSTATREPSRSSIVNEITTLLTQHTLTSQKDPVAADRSLPEYSSWSNDIPKGSFVDRNDFRGQTLPPILADEIQAPAEVSETGLATSAEVLIQQEMDKIEKSHKIDLHTTDFTELVKQMLMPDKQYAI